MLKYRVLTALILIPLFLVLLFKLPPGWFFLFTGAVVLWGMWEWSGFLLIGNKFLRGFYVLLGLGLLLIFFELPVIYVLYATFVWWLLALAIIVVYQRQGILLGKNLTALALMGYIVLVPCWMAINYIRNAPEGIYTLLFLFVLIWGADTGAYFAGKAWGKHRLASEVSPGKTWEGCIGAFIMTIGIAYAGLLLSKSPYSLWLVVTVLSLVTVFFSIVGDLFESLLKRNAGLKDSGTLLPGHGGLLDRIDSLTAAAPIFALGATLIGKYS